MEMYDPKPGKQEETYQATGRESETQRREEETDESILEILTQTFGNNYEW